MLIELIAIALLAEGLKSYPRHAGAAKLQMQKIQEMEQLASVQGMPTDRNTLNKLMALHPGLNNQMNNNHHMVNRGGGGLSGSAQAALALTNYQNMLMRQNSMNSNPNSVQQEASSSFGNSNQSPSSSFQGAGATALIPGSMQHLPVSGFSSPHLPSPQPQQLPQQLQQRSMSANSLLQQNHPQASQGNQALQQQMIQQLLQDMSNNNSGVQQHSLSGPTANGNGSRNGMIIGGNSSATASAAATPNLVGSNGPVPSRSNSFKAASTSDSSAAAGGGGGSDGFNHRAPDLPQNLHLQEDIVQDIAHAFPENGFFNSDLDDNPCYPWKA